MRDEFSALEGKGAVDLAGQGLYQVSTTPIHKLGDRRIVGDRVFRYARASENLAAGKLCTSAATMDSEDAVSVAHPIGTKDVKVVVSVATAANSLAEGFLTVDNGTGAGDMYKIRSNTAQSVVGQTMVISLYDGLQQAWSTVNTDVTWMSSIYNVQEANTDRIELPIGVPLISVSAGSYFWIQTAGIASVLCGVAFGNAGAQRMVGISGTVAGAVEVAEAGEAVVGQAVLDAANYEANKYQLIRLTLE